MTANNTNHFDVILEKVGNQPLKTTKILCEELGFGLAKAKGLVDNAPVTIISDIDSAKALGLKQQLEEAGNTVSVPGMEIETKPIVCANNTGSVEEAFDAIFGTGAAKKATPPVKNKCETKEQPRATEKRTTAAENDAFDAIFGGAAQEKKHYPNLRLIK